MSNTVNAIDQIRSTAEPSALLAIGGVKNTPLADQLQFSSLLKTFVETPQEALSAVQGNKKPIDRTDFTQKLDKISQNKGTHHNDLNSRANSSESHPQHAQVRETVGVKSKNDEPRVASVTKNALREESTNSLSTDKGKESGISSNQISINSNVQNEDFNSPAKNPIAGTLEVAKSGDSRIRNQTFEPQNSLKREQSSQTSSLKVQQNLITDTNTNSRTSTNKDLTVPNENLDPIINKKSIKGSTRGTNDSASQMLAQRQAQDLTQRLEQASRLQIQVRSSDNAGKQTSTPSQALTNGTPFVTLGSNGESQNILGNNSQRSGMNGLADRQAPNNHFMAQNNGASPTAQSDAATASLAQSIRVQAQIMGGQQSTNTAALAPKITPITADTGNISNVNSLNNVNQLSQGSKTNPSTLRQPYKPPTTMEQVSVHIQKAVSNGADKINIKLHPAHLGRVEVRLDIATDGQLSAIIMAEKPETLELLQRDIKGLEKALQQAGLDTNLNSFNFGLKQRAGQQRDASQNLKNGDDPMASNQTDTSDYEMDPPILMNQQKYGHNMSTHGGIDIRV